MASASRIPSEHGYSPLCGCYGVHVSAKPDSRLEKTASLEILYDEFVDYNHTAHYAILPWNGEANVEPAYVERLLNLAKVPRNIQEDNAVDMVLRCIEGIVKDPKRTQFSSVYVEVMSDKDTFDYAALFGEEEDQEAKKNKNKSASNDKYRFMGLCHE